MKHLQFLIFLAFFCLATLSSCNKNLNTQNVTKVEGTVLQKETLVPVENAAVVFYQFFSKGIGQGIEEWPIDTVFTDESGAFIWETVVNPRNETYNSAGGFYIKTIYSEKYFDISRDELSIQGNESTFYYLDREQLEIKMTPKSYISVSIKNVEDPETDYFRFGVDLGSGFEELFGEDENFIIRVFGNTDLEMIYTTDITLESIQKDEFYVSAFDTLKLEFEY